MTLVLRSRLLTSGILLSCLVTSFTRCEFLAPAHIIGRAVGQAVVAHAFNPRTLEAETGRFLSLRPAWSRVNSRTARATQRKKQKKKVEGLQVWIRRGKTLGWS